MASQTTPLTVGDWVHSYSPGVWQIFRILEGVQKTRFTLNERKKMHRQPIIFCKRFLDDSWSPSFTAETCDPAVVQPLSGDERAKVEEFITKNPDVASQFYAYEPRDLDCAMGLMLSLPPGVGKADLESMVKEAFADIGEKGLTNDEVLQRLAASSLGGYVSQRMINATLRFICKDHELRGNEYVFREAQVIMV